jgi:ribonuclease D
MSAGKPVRILTTIPHIEWLAARLADERRVAVDLESDGFYVYHEKVCLVQLSSETEDFIVDPLAAKDLSPLGPLFADPGVEKVFHACEYDVLGLKRDFGFKVHSIFDTMAAARLLGSPRLGLAPLIEKHFGVALCKKLQRANWGRRPLSDEQIEYARADTHYLIRLRDILEKDLSGRGLLAEAREAFKRLEGIAFVDKPFHPDDFWRMSGSRNLSPRGRAVLRELFLFRERTAASLDRAPFRVMPDSLLLSLAMQPPHTHEELLESGEMSPYLYQHFAAGVLEAVGRGMDAEPIDRPPPSCGREAMGEAVARRFEALRSWRKRLAEQRGVQPGVILGNDEIRALAEAPEKSSDEGAWLAGLSDFKRQAYGVQIGELLRKAAPAGPRRRRGRR